MLLSKTEYLADEVSSLDVLPIMNEDLIDSMINHDREEIRACAARYLYCKNDMRGEYLFKASLREGDVAVKRIYLHVFSKVKDEFITGEFFKAAMDESQPDLCLEFAAQVEGIPDTMRVRSAVEKELESEDPHRRWMAIRICGKLDSVWFRRMLEHALTDEPDRVLTRLIKTYLGR